MDSRLSSLFRNNIWCMSRNHQSAATVTPPRSTMLKQLGLALLSAAALLTPSTGEVLKGSRKPVDGAQEPQDNRPGRGLKHKKYKHHAAIQEAFATQVNVHDDDLAAIQLAIVDTSPYLDTATNYYGYHEDEVEYLSPEITPKPFINCYPESWHKDNKAHGKHNHKHTHDKHHEGKHHLHEHHHIKEPKHHTGPRSKSKSAYYTPPDATLLVPETTYTVATVATTGKGKGKGEEVTSANGKGKGEDASTYSKSKSNGYYRQRNLAGHTRRNHGFARRGHRGQIKKRQSDVEAVIVTNFGSSLIGPEDGEEEYHEPPSPSLPRTKKYSQVNHHHHGEDLHLPICPAGAVRMTIPTISPLDLPTPANATTPTVAPPGGAPAEGAPVDIPPGTERILVQSTLSFGLFPENTPREATPEEIAGLMTRTSKWLYDELKPTFPTLQSGMAVFLNQEFDAGAEFPIMIDFDANGFFTEGAFRLGP
jgi:hypothetical protein